MSVRNSGRLIYVGSALALLLLIVAVSVYVARRHAAVPAVQQTLVPKVIGKDPLPANAQMAAAVKLGADIMNQTGKYAAPYVGNALSCSSCHINAGQQTGAYPLAGIAGLFPLYDGRGGQIIDLEQRLQSCFIRSENGTAPPLGSQELSALTAYITWISDGQPVGQAPAWRSAEQIGPANRIAINKLQPAKGQQLFAATCASCHGADGQGTTIAPPLWGPHSFNTGAGAARVYSLANFIRYSMPQNAPGTLTDEQAQDLAAFIDGQRRPVYSGMAKDYPKGNIPVDAVYYSQRYPKNPLQTGTPGAQALLQGVGGQ